MVDIHHAGHTVEPETVKLILFHVEPKIAEEEPENFVAAVVEQTAVPKVVPSLAAFVEVQMVRAVE